MSELHTRVRDYLDKKKPRQVETTLEIEVVRSESQAWEDFKSDWKYPLLILKAALTLLTVLFVVGIIVTIDIQNDCWSNKECREWVKNR